MSWLFSQALVEEYLPAICSDGEPCVRLSGNPTQQAYLSQDKMTEFSRLSRFGMTFRPLTADRGEAVLTSYLEAFPARTLVQPEREPESLVKSQECGFTWPASWARYDQSTSSWKTRQCSVLGDLEPFSETWPRWGTMQDGEFWGQQMSERPISETESGLSHRYLFPTPTCNPEAPNHGSNSKGPHNLKEVAMNGWSPGQMWPTPNQRDWKDTGATQGNRKSPNLGTAVHWPTPTVCGNYNRKGASATSGDGLATAVAKWPTPQARDYKGSSGRSMKGQEFDLPTAVKKYQTPVSRMWKDNGQSPSELNRNSETLAMQAGGSLNPTWVEWLMGWPLAWTDLKPLEMAKFQQWQQQHGN